MNTNKLIVPNYTEEEVWDLLSEYLEEKCQADRNTIQRGIYVDLYRDGSYFEIKNNSDEFGYLYCNRNLNFNISGNIIFSVDSAKNEVFTLESICRFLNKPFPKPIITVELTPSELEEKQKNINFIKKVNKINYERDKTQNKVLGICIQLIHAFEYSRALTINNNIYHIEQLISDVADFNFVQEKNISQIDEFVILHPNTPLLDDLLEFIETKKNVIRDFFQIRYSEVVDKIKNQIYPNYDVYFSDRMRRFGSLLIPLCNVDNELVSAVNIMNIADDQSNYTIMSEVSKHTSGSFQINTRQISSDESIFITVDIDTADVLARINQNPVFASISVDNYIRVLDEVRAKYPDNFIVLVTNNPFVKFLNTSNQNDFREELVVKLMLAFAQSSSRLARCGLLMPTIDLSEKSKLYNFSDIFLAFGLEEVCYHINQELQKALERLNNNINESEYILELYNNAKNSLYGNHHVRLPELLTEDELKPPKVQIDHEIDQAVIPTHGVDSVLHIEGRKELLDWFNEPIHPEIAKKEKALQDQFSRFIAAAPVELDEDFNPSPLSEPFP